MNELRRREIPRFAFNFLPRICHIKLKRNHCRRQHLAKEHTPCFSCFSLLSCVYYIHCSYDDDMNGRMKRLSDENNHHNKEKEEKNRTNISAYGSIFTLYSVYILYMYIVQARKEIVMKERRRWRIKIIIQRQRHTLKSACWTTTENTARELRKREREGKYFVEATHWRQEACARCEWDWYSSADTCLRPTCWTAFN